MKTQAIIGIMGLFMFAATSCNSKTESPAVENLVEENVEVVETPVEIVPVEEQIISVTGKITKIENGKDGYMATIQSNDKEYVATISSVNLQKTNSEYKTHKVDDVITVEGPSWNDEAGKAHIKVERLK